MTPEAMLFLNRCQERQEACDHGFPGALSRCVLCIVDQALAEVTALQAQHDAAFLRTKAAEAAQGRAEQRVAALVEAWNQSWDCSRDPGHRIMHAAHVKAFGAQVDARTAESQP